MLRLPSISPWLLLSGLALLCSACASTATDIAEAQPIGQKQRWYWVGSTSYLDHASPAKPENYWFEVDGERALLNADCNNANAKALTTKEGRLWITGIANTRSACPAGSLEGLFLKQLGQTTLTEQRGEVMRIGLSQYGDAMFFARDPAARFSSYRCEGGESMALIVHAKALNVWLGEEFSQTKIDGGNKSAAQPKDQPLDLEESIDAISRNCRKIITRK